MPLINDINPAPLEPCLPETIILYPALAWLLEDIFLPFVEPIAVTDINIFSLPVMSPPTIFTSSQASFAAFIKFFYKICFDIFR